MSLLLPALFPSWRFFRTIAPSPRVEYAWLSQPDAEPANWQPARPRPARLDFAMMLRRLLWNPKWNETLYWVSLSERVAHSASAHAADQLGQRLRRDLLENGSAPPQAPFFTYRLIFISRQDGQLQREVIYSSPPIAFAS
ncbi:MAG: hypothetical protein ACPGNV_08700 [Mangrovicoccus sp.]